MYEKQGYFIVLDGMDSSSKTTQVQELKQYFESVGKKVITTREPGGTSAANLVRKMLIEKDRENWDGVSELLLFSAARRNHVENLIKPALRDGYIVLCDRFVPSTIAYQGYGHGIPIDMIKKTTEIAIGDFQPDLTVLFLMDPKLCLLRATKRGGTDSHYEDIGSSFHDRVYNGFENIYLDNLMECDIDSPSYRPIGHIHIDEENTINEVTAMLLEEIKKFLPELL